MNQESMRVMRRAFAELIADNPEEFDACVKEYQRRGPEGFPKPKSPTRPETPNKVLAFLLADYQSRENETRQAWIERKAQEGVRTADRFQSRQWHGPDAIESNLKKAQKLYKQDTDFAGDVDFYQWAFGLLG